MLILYQGKMYTVKGKDIIILILSSLVIILTVVCIILFIPLSQDNDITTQDFDLTRFNLITDTDLDYFAKKEIVKSNVELVLLNDEYVLIWKEHVDTYYKALIDYYNSTKNTYMVELTQNDKEAFDKYAEDHINYYQEFTLSTYDSGSIVPTSISAYKLRLYREEAIELYFMCEQNFIDVEKP